MASVKKPSVENTSTVNVTDDREAHSKFWIAVYTRSNCEKKTAHELSRMGIDTYLPTKTVIKQWSDRKKVIDSVIIPMVVFLHLTYNDILAIKRHPLILRPLSMPGQKSPAIIPQEQIDRLRFMVEGDNNVIFTENKFYSGDQVRVVSGGLKGLIGYVAKDASNTTRININIDYLGCASVEINITDIEIV